MCISELKAELYRYRKFGVTRAIAAKLKSVCVRNVKTGRVAKKFLIQNLT